MQLGELQNQISRFEQRAVSVLAVSVDQPHESLGLIERLGLSFDLGSDSGQKVVSAFKVRNPDTRELALHAVYIIDRDRRIFYRKVALRRPTSDELIDAIDAHRGVYPQHDHIEQIARINVAYPTNEFQALIEVSLVDKLPASVDPLQMQQMLAQIRDLSSDDSMIAFRNLVYAADDVTTEEWLSVAAWLTQQVHLADNTQALDAGRDLNRRLARVRELEVALAAETGVDQIDELQQTLAKARGGLSLRRGEISQHAGEWHLQRVKTMLRSYREVARVAGKAAT